MCNAFHIAVNVPFGTVELFMMRKWLMCRGRTVGKRLLSAGRWAAEEKPRPKPPIIIIIFIELFVLLSSSSPLILPQF